jgi:hypothetical protein
MNLKLGDTVILKADGKKYRIVGDKKTPVQHQIFGDKFPENCNEYFIKEISSVYSQPIQVKAQDVDFE